MLIVVAIDGATLISGDAQELQQLNVDRALHPVAALAREHQLVVTHGHSTLLNRLAAAQNAAGEPPSYPLDVLGSLTQGMHGYFIEQAFRDEARGQQVVALLTQVVVDAHDRAFAHPTHRVGPAYAHNAARRLADDRGWHMAPEGTGYRRVVAGPEPQRIIELGAIRLLAEGGIIPVCAASGSVAVVVDPSGAYRGVEAVVDGDLTAALLARDLGADMLLLLTHAEAVELDGGSAPPRKVRTATPLDLRLESFAAGGIAQKVEAACRFVEATGRRAAIGSVPDAAMIVKGLAGTSVVAHGITPMSFWDAM